jgi:hypothetical protein
MNEFCRLMIISSPTAPILLLHCIDHVSTYYKSKYERANNKHNGACDRTCTCKSLGSQPSGCSLRLISHTHLLVSAKSNRQMIRYLSVGRKTRVFPNNPNQRAIDPQPIILIFLICIDNRTITKFNFLSLVSTPLIMFPATNFFVLTSNDGNMGSMVGSGYLLPNEFLDPPFIVVNYAIGRFDYDPSAIMVADDACSKIVIHS